MMDVGFRAMRLVSSALLLHFKCKFFGYFHAVVVLTIKYRVPVFGDRTVSLSDFRQYFLKMGTDTVQYIGIFGLNT